MPKLVVDKTLVEDLTIDELIAIQEGELKTLKNVLGRFVEDDTGKAMEPEAAAAWIGTLKLKEFTSITEGIATQIKDTVPNG